MPPRSIRIRWSIPGNPATFFALLTACPSGNLLAVGKEIQVVKDLKTILNRLLHHLLSGELGFQFLDSRSQPFNAFFSLL